MRPRTWRFLIAFVLLVCYVALFMTAGEQWIAPRKHALAVQFSTGVTHLGARMLTALAIAAVTVLFGRIYCSVVCPAGLLQELFTRVGRGLKLLRLGHARASPPAALLAALALVVVLTGAVAIANHLDPIGLFGSFLRTLGDAAHGRIAVAGITFGGLSVALLAAAFLVVIPLFRGRWFCDRLCPVGAVLAALDALPGRRVALDPDKCVACGGCDKVCPARCIDVPNKRIETDRCLACLECVPACKFGAIGYGRVAEGRERRGFLRWLTAAVAAGFVFSREIAGRRGVFATAADALPAVAPPGSTGNIRHKQRCVDCQACVLSCPVGIIRATPAAIGRPVLDYDHGYCQYNCLLCSESCPAGVFEPIGLEEKRRIRVARTELLRDRCVVIRQGTECGACAEVCPTHAVSMISQGSGLPTIPDFDADYCIGCGACYHVCPVEPRAFVVTGLDRHETSRGVRLVEHPAAEVPAVPESNDGEDDGGLTDFPF